MKHAILGAVFLIMLGGNAVAVTPFPVLDVRVGDLKPGERIPDKHAFCVPDAERHTKDGGNISPTVTWSQGPESTKSYALIMHDTDVPTKFDNANTEGKVIPADMKRKDFYHWVLVDIPAESASVLEGKESDGIDRDGKPAGKQPHGVRGVNDFGTFMKGKFGGYDGPCPPWNDAKLHHYHFTVYALDTESLGLNGDFTGQDAVRAMTGHVLAKGSMTGTYTQNPALMK